MIRKYCFSVVIMLVSIGMYAQECNSSSFGNAYVPSNGFISIFAEHSFEFDGGGLFPGLILTDKSNTPGYVNFTQTASWLGAEADAHVNGFVRTFSSDPFVFPIGNGSRLRMVAVSGSANATAGYVDADPSIATGVMTIANAELDAVSAREYWIMSGDNETTVTLTWDQLSNVEDIVDGDINKLTIVGWDGNSWVVIPSGVNDFMLQANSSNTFDQNITTSFSIGSLTSTAMVNLDDFQIITLGSLAVPRSSAVAEGDISVFPNPARVGAPTYVSYDLVGKTGKMEIYDGFNRLVFTQLLNEESGNVLLPNLNLVDDKYVVTLIEADGSKKSKFLIVIN